MTHLIGDRLIPLLAPLSLIRGILHVGPTKSFTNLAGFSLRVAMVLLLMAEILHRLIGSLSHYL